MAKLKIFTFPDMILAKKALPIARVEKTYFKLADDMLETMYEAPGVGLAANQVGILERFIVVDTEYKTYDPEDPDEVEQAKEALKNGGELIDGQVVIGRKPLVLINPKIILREGSISTEEGCLSVPKYYADVTRSEKVKVQYQTIDGLETVLAAEGLLSVCLQHEMDHLEGTLFIDRLSQLKKEFAKKKLIRARKEREEG